MAIKGGKENRRSNNQVEQRKTNPKKSNNSRQFLHTQEGISRLKGYTRKRKNSVLPRYTTGKVQNTINMQKIPNVCRREKEKFQEES